MQEKLNHPKIVLERLKMADLTLLYAAILHSRKEISPYLSWLDAGYNEKKCRDFIRLQNINWETGIEYTYSIKNHVGAILGMIGLHLFDVQNDVASLGYWMNSAYVNQGFCTQAVKLLVANSLLPLNLIRIEIIVAVNNLASQKVAINAGAKFETVLKNRIRLNGRAIDANVYRFIPLTESSLY